MTTTATQIATFRLTAQDGALYFPHGGIPDGPLPCDRSKDEPALLLAIYAAGDCDTIPWPMVSDYASEADLRGRLASALYDERECNPFWPLGPVRIELPNGDAFDLDTELHEAESRRASQRAAA